MIWFPQKIKMKIKEFGYFNRKLRQQIVREYIAKNTKSQIEQVEEKLCKFQNKIRGRTVSWWV